MLEKTHFQHRKKEFIVLGLPGSTMIHRSGMIDGACGMISIHQQP